MTSQTRFVQHMICPLNTKRQKVVYKKLNRKVSFSGGYKGSILCPDVDCRILYYATLLQAFRFYILLLKLML